MSLLTGGLGGSASGMIVGGLGVGRFVPPIPDPEGRVRRRVPRLYPEPVYQGVQRTVILQGSVLQNIETRLDIVGTQLMIVGRKLGMSAKVLMRTETIKDLTGLILERVTSRFELQGTGLHKVGAVFGYSDKIREITTDLIEILDELNSLDQLDILGSLNKIIKELDI